MKILLTFLFVILISGCFSGCALFQPAAEKVQEGVDRYCGTLTEAERQLIRNSVNPTPDGNNIHIHCLGDSPE